MMKFTVEFYEDSKGFSELWNFLELLRMKAVKSKDARIQFNQITRYIELLSINGLNLPDNILKNITGDIWELRPGNNRVLFFSFKHNTFVLLHHFRKKTQKTPQSEIQKAISEAFDYTKRKESPKL